MGTKNLATVNQWLPLHSPSFPYCRWQSHVLMQIQFALHSTWTDKLALLPCLALCNISYHSIQRHNCIASKSSNRYLNSFGVLIFAINITSHLHKIASINLKFWLRGFNYRPSVYRKYGTVKIRVLPPSCIWPQKWLLIIRFVYNPNLNIDIKLPKLCFYAWKSIVYSET